MRRVHPEPTRTGRVRAGRLAGAAAVLVALGLLWLALHQSPAASTTALAAPAPPPLPVAPASVAPAAVAPTPPAAPAARPGGLTHLSDDPRCVIRDPASMTAEPASAPATLARDAQARLSRARLLARLAASPDPYANAVAVWLDEADEDDEARRVERQRRLAAMAASTRDPRLYALALRSCWGRADHPCEPGLSARRWSELEPGNAMPWLMMFDEAARSDDESGLLEALFHATHARRLAERVHAPLQPIIDATEATAGSMAAANLLATQAIGLSAAEVLPFAARVCSVARPADANVLQECLAMADIMARRADSIMTRGWGRKMRERLTGEAPPADQHATNERLQRAQFALATTSSCDELHARLALLRRMADEGEVAVLQRIAR